MNGETQVLSTVFCDVMERFAFMFADVVEKDALPEPSRPWLLARMEFHGERHGEVSLAAPAELSREIAANVMGLEPEEVLDQHGIDALKEMLNITCGNLLTELAGSEPIFDLTVPTVEPLAADQWSAIVASDRSTGLAIDDYSAILLFRGECDATPGAGD